MGAQPAGLRQRKHRGHVAHQSDARGPLDFQQMLRFQVFQYLLDNAKLETQCVGYIAGLQVTAIVEDLHGDLLDSREGHTRLLERVRHLGHGVAGKRVGWRAQLRAQLPGRGFAVLAYGTMKQG